MAPYHGKNQTSMQWPVADLNLQRKMCVTALDEIRKS